MKSKLFWLNVKDFIKGAVVAILTGLFTYLGNELTVNADVNKDLFLRCGIAALAAFIGYLIKNLLTNSKDQFLKKE